MVPYVTVDWTIQDLPKQLRVPSYAWSDIETDVKLQISVNTYFQLNVDIPDNYIHTVYNAENGTLLFSYAEKEGEFDDDTLDTFTL